MKATADLVNALSAIEHPSDATDTYIESIDKRREWEAKELERLGFRRFAARVRAARSGIIPRPKDRPLVDPSRGARGDARVGLRGGPWGGPSGGSSGSGQSGGLRVGYAATVPCVITPDVWQ